MIVRTTVTRTRWHGASRHLSSSTDFFTYNSRRQSRRRQRLDARHKQKQRQFDHQSVDQQLEELEKDTRTAMDIIWPNPYKGERNPYAFPQIRDWNHFKLALLASFKDYMWTWKGFRTPGLILPDIPEIDAVEQVRQQQEKQKQQQQKETTTEQEFDEEMERTLHRNTQFVQEHAQAVRQEIQDRTGIRHPHDLRQVATECVKLLNVCVNQFLSGYRQGRDDEVENMVQKYFMDFKKKVTENANESNKRKRKRRTMPRYRRI